MSQSVLQIEREKNIGIVDFRSSLRDREILSEIRDELGDVFGEIESDSRIHVVILKGIECGRPDKTFGFMNHWKIENEPSSSLTRCVGMMNRPVIAELNGRIVGQGLELALACDLRMAAEGSSFCLPHVRRGLMPYTPVL